MATHIVNCIDQSTNTETFNIIDRNDHGMSSSTDSFYNMRLKDILKIVGALLVPLILGIAATILTIKDGKSNEENRLKDIDIAQKQRQQAVYLADQAEKERIMATYLKDISALLLEKNAILDKNSIASTVVRAKTLTTLRQLDLERKRQVIFFLYETGLIKKDSEYLPINLFDAKIDNLDMNLPKSKQKFDRRDENLQILLRGVSLVNSSFTFRLLYKSDFSQTDLTNANFMSAQTGYADFSYAIMQKTDFTNAFVDKALFSYADLTDSNISDKQLSTAISFQGAIFPNGTTAPLKNLLINGDAEQSCSNNRTVVPLPWDVMDGSISAILRPPNEVELNNKCYFSSLSSENVSIMQQEIDLNDYSMWILNKQRFYGFNINFSGIENGTHDVIVNIKELSSNGTILKKKTVCSRPVNNEYCDSQSKIPSGLRCGFTEPLYLYGKTVTQSVEIEIIFRRRFDHNLTISAYSVVTTCDNIGFYFYPAL